jgi:tetratricopeptide (TPR) repeat protein
VTEEALPRLYINHVAELDWLIALEFGRVDDAQPPDNWRGVSDQFGYLHDGPDGRALGFKVIDFCEFDAESPDVADIWGEPHFDVPLLGLSAVPAGEVVLATRALLGEEATINRAYFSEAVATKDPEEALPLWLACLESGDSMAHFALGYTLYELGRFPEAYRHLRHYTEIAPHGSWNWCWFGKGAEAVGEKDEAIAAYQRALELEADGDQETEATERLKELLGFEGMYRIRERLNEKTDGRIGLYSTAEHYSSGPVAKVLRYYQYDKEAPLECATCGWSGRSEEGDVGHFDEVFDVSCPDCDAMLLVVGWPTLEETREAAERGNPEARRALRDHQSRKEPNA